MLTLRFTDFSKIVNMTAIKKSFCVGRWIFLIKDILQSTHNLNPSRVREMGRFSFLSGIKITITRGESLGKPALSG